MDSTPTTLRSEQTGELAKALSTAQLLIKPPKKGKTAQIKSDKGSYGYSYADLADVIECCREPLGKNGLATAQTLRCEDGHMVLVTTLLHSSGQWIASEYPLLNYNRPQEQGSAITYARRYSLTSLLGIAAEDDDDGQAAQHAEPVKREERRAEPGPVSGDAAAILTIAAELSERLGVTPDQIIKDASSFTDEKTGKTVPGFTDPRQRTGNPKWLKGTRTKLEKMRYEEGLKAEVTEPVPF